MPSRTFENVVLLPEDSQPILAWLLLLSSWETGWYYGYFDYTTCFADALVQHLRCAIGTSNMKRIMHGIESANPELWQVEGERVMISVVIFPICQIGFIFLEDDSTNAYAWFVTLIVVFRNARYTIWSFLTAFTGLQVWQWASALT